MPVRRVSIMREGAAYVPPIYQASLRRLLTQSMGFPVVMPVHVKAGFALARLAA